MGRQYSAYDGYIVGGTWPTTEYGSRYWATTGVWYLVHRLRRLYGSWYLGYDDRSWAILSIMDMPGTSAMTVIW